MFSGCMGLVEITSLPATNLEEGCYYGMFEMYSSTDDFLTVSDTLDDEFTVPYRIPSSGTGIYANDSTRWMFFYSEDDLSINTTYYLPSWVTVIGQ
jgi:hypothetical protein